MKVIVITILFCFCTAEPSMIFDFCFRESKKKKYLNEKPEYDIYVMEDYPPQKYTFEQCVEMHKEAAQPAMANTLHMQVYADIELNFNTTKKVISNQIN